MLLESGMMSRIKFLDNFIDKSKKFLYNIYIKY